MRPRGRSCGAWRVTRAGSGPARGRRTAGRLASGGDDGTLRLWDASTGEELRAPGGSRGRGLGPARGRRTAVRLASGGDDGTLRLWDASTGEELRRLEGHEGVGLDLRVVAGRPDPGLGRRRRDAEAVGCVHGGGAAGACEGHQGRGSGPARGRRTAGPWPRADDDGTLRLWDASTGEALRRLEGHEGWVWACAWSPDGRTPGLGRRRRDAEAVGCVHGGGAAAPGGSPGRGLDLRVVAGRPDRWPRAETTGR